MQKEIKLHDSKSLSSLRHLTTMNYLPENEKNSITQRLIRRGFKVLCINPTEGLLIPQDDSKKIINEYYLHLKKYSFRLFLRDVIRYRDLMSIKDLQKYCSENTARRYLKLLVKWNIVTPEDDEHYRMVPEGINSFGDTFEWFIAQVLIREFFCPTAWGIRIREAPTGGDYDVISSVEECLLYIEAKSSPPKHIDSNEVSAFLDRIEDLRPHFSIFLEDTHLRMKDKIVQLFQQELRRWSSLHGGSPLEVERLERELFTIGKNIFIINSKPNIGTNIGTCIKNYLRSSGIKLFCPS
jgi:hypothetical protein